MTEFEGAWAQKWAQSLRVMGWAHLVKGNGELLSSPQGGRTIKVATFGLDIAKQAFQVHGAD